MLCSSLVPPREKNYTCIKKIRGENHTIKCCYTKKCNDGVRQESDLYRKLFCLKIRFFFRSGREAVGSTVTAGREGPDLGLFQGSIGRVNYDHFVLVEFIS